MGNKFCARRIAAIKEHDKPAYELEPVEPEDSDDRVAFAQSKPGWRKRSKFQEQQSKRVCYICGGRHFWKYCPDKCCPGCGQKGHILKDCSTVHKGKDVKTILTADTKNLATELSVLISVRLNGMRTEALLDCGAGPSVIDIEVVQELGLDQLMKDKIGEVYGLSREPVSVIGKLELILDLGDDQVLEHEFDVLKNTGCTCILGRDLLKRLGPTEFDWQSQQVRLGNVWKDSRATIEGGEPLTRARVAVLEDSKDSMSPIPRNIINQDLPFSQREALSKLLREYESVFAVNPKQPQMAKGVVHRINTGSALPNKQRPIPVAPAVETEIAQVVNEMLENKICRPSNSPWASRVLLVTKRDGSKRFVVDYRKLNEVTQIDSYPMPCAMDILDRMSGHKYFSFVDGASAYWSIGVEESDKYKTAFVTQRGLYEMNRMPFGLVNSQSSYNG